MGRRSATSARASGNLGTSPVTWRGSRRCWTICFNRSNAIRSIEGDAHGKKPGAPDVPQSLVNLAIHLAGAFIVYLAEVRAEIQGG